MRYGHCFVCLRLIPSGKAVYWANLRIRVCNGKCNDLVESLSKDCSKSKRGKFRTNQEWLRLLTDASIKQLDELKG